MRRPFTIPIPRTAEDTGRVLSAGGEVNGGVVGLAAVQLTSEACRRLLSRPDMELGGLPLSPTSRYQSGCRVNPWGDPVLLSVLNEGEALVGDGSADIPV